MWRIFAPLQPPVRRSTDVHRHLLRHITTSYFVPALLVFDWALMFTREVNRVWLRKFTGTTVVYALIRYSSLLSYVALCIIALLRTSEDKVRFLNAHLLF